MQPSIIYGTAWKKDRTVALVVAAVLNGFRAIDTACQPKHYREDLVGEALQVLQEKHEIKREDLWIQTKYTSIGGQDQSQPLPYDPSQPIHTQVLTSFRTSLRNLKTAYLDSLILHSPLDTIPETLEAWRVLMQLQDEGKVRKIGVSNTYDVSVLEVLGKERKVQVVQNRWYEGNQWDKEVVAYCRANDIQYQSFWTLSGSPSVLRSPAVNALAQRKGYTAAQVMFRAAQMNGITPLCGSTNEEHMREALEAEQIDLSGGSEEDTETSKELRRLLRSGDVGEDRS